MLSTAQNPRNAAVLSERLRALQEAIASTAMQCGRSVDQVTLLAVSKGQSVDRLREAAGLGLVQFGENYLAEALPKIAALKDLPLQWHFIGRLQSNKTAAVAANFAWVHSVDRLKIAERLSAQRDPDAPDLNLCIQVKLLPDEEKAGVDPEACLPLIRAVAGLERIKLRGLMCMLPLGTPLATQRHAFAQLRELSHQAQGQGFALDTLSMGMSDDWPQAVAEGSTILRVGGALFGPRATPGITR